jgi:hypothetical protein
LRFCTGAEGRVAGKGVTVGSGVAGAGGAPQAVAIRTAAKARTAMAGNEPRDLIHILSMGCEA